MHDDKQLCGKCAALPLVRSEPLLDDLLSRVIALHAELGDQANQHELSADVRCHLFGQRLALRTVREWIEKRGVTP